MTVHELRLAFETVYGKAVQATYFSPDRVNQIDEQINYNNGSVFPCASCFGTYLLLAKNENRVMNFKSLNRAEIITIDFDQLTIPLIRSWVNYPLGVIAQFVKNEVALTEGYDILIWGNVPKGAGLSSPASLELVTAYAMNDQLGTGYNRTILAQISQNADSEFKIAMCSIMEQSAFVNDAKDSAMHLNCDSMEFELVPMKLKCVKIFISNTHLPNKLDSGAFGQRMSECKIAVKNFNTVHPLKYLSELTDAEFKSIESAITDVIAHKRTRDVVRKVQRISDAVKALKANDSVLFGKLMNFSHATLCDDYKVNEHELDTIEEVWKVEDVIGSRMTDGGLDGFDVSLVKDEDINTFIEKVGTAYETKTGIKSQFYIAEIGDEACRIN